MAQQVFTGRYQIERHLARGGMAEVYLARDLLLERPVALKVLFPEFAADRSFVERFRREARSAASLNHPNIVSIYDWGEEEGTYFIVMEYVRGPTLREVIRAEAPLLPHRAVEITTEIALALSFAHRQGVVHRDVKPGNVILTPTGQVKVADFGIARAGDPADQITQAGTVMGTATYFSPEQAQGLPVDARTDIYALGVVLYEMVAGRAPFVGDSPLAVAYQHVRETPEPPSALNPDVPPELDAVVAKAMAKDPSNRYPSADAFRADLVRFHQGQPVLAEPLVSTTVVTPGPPPVGPAYDDTRVSAPAAPPTAVTMPVPTPPRRRRSSPYILILLVLLALLGVGLFLLARQLGVGSGPTRVIVPSVVGEDQNAAVNRLQDLGLRVQQTPAPDDQVPQGQVKAQDPPAGTRLKKGSAVTITVSSGPPPVPVPDVTNQNVDRARATLDKLGLGAHVTPQPNDKVKENTVVSQDPAPNTVIPKGQAVNLVISSGPEKAKVPDVTGLDPTDAANLLGQTGFRVTTGKEPSPTVPSGAVARTDPPAGTTLAKGSSVMMVVSSGPPPTTVPTTIITTNTTTFFQF